MRKRRIAFFTLIFFLAALFPIFPAEKVQAYSNNAYFDDLKIGLESMATSALTGKTYGDYYLNDTELASGTVLNFKISNGKININGKEYETIKIVPKHYGSYFFLTGVSRTNRYTGILEFRVDNNRIYPINTLPVEDYLKGVVGYEMSNSYPIEALKAQAIAARTYALRHKGALIKTKGFDFNDTITYQVYYGYNPNFKNVEKAVEDTVGQVAIYNNYLIDALFSSSHGGYSENAVNVWGNSVAYLVAKEDIYNGQAIDNGAWSMGPVSLTAAGVESELKTRNILASTDKFVRFDLNSITKYPSGRVSNIDIVYDDSEGLEKIKKITADKARTFLPLQSSKWDLDFDGTTYKFTGKGYGHGLGMSQIGAKQRALLGQAYDGILKFYYNGIELANLYIAPTISSYTQSTEQVYIGQPIAFKAQGQKGTGNYLFRYVVFKDGTAVSDTGYIDSSDYNYTPMQPGNYKIVVYLRDAQSSKEFDDSKTLNVRTLEMPSITGIAASGANSIVNQPVNFTVQTKGGSGDFLYKYSVYLDGKLVTETAYGSSKTYTYTPVKTGSYKITANIKDKVDINREIEPKTSTINVFSAPQVTEVKVEGMLYAGRDITVKAASTAGGPEGVLFKYEVLRNNSICAVRNYSTDKNYTFIPNTAGTYVVKTYVKDAVSKNAYDSTNSSTVVIQAPPLSITSSTLTYGMKNNDVKALQNSLIKLGYKISSATGYYGNETKAAVIAFQKSKGLKQTGIVDRITLNAINDSLIAKNNVSVKPPVTSTPTQPSAPTPTQPVNTAITISTLPLSYGKRHKDVTVLQNALIKLGFKISSATGYFGNETKAAVIAFQKSKGLKQTGIVDKTTLDSINASLIANSNASVKPPVTSTPAQPSAPTPTQPASTAITISTLPLSYGKRHKDVTVLQNALIKLGFKISSATGYFGNETKAAVIAFQKSKGLKQTGIVDKTTLNAINSALAKK